MHPHDSGLVRLGRLRRKSRSTKHQLLVTGERKRSSVVSCYQLLVPNECDAGWWQASALQAGQSRLLRVKVGGTNHRHDPPRATNHPIVPTQSPTPPTVTYLLSRVLASQSTTWQHIVGHTRPKTKTLDAFSDPHLTWLPASAC